MAWAQESPASSINWSTENLNKYKIILAAKSERTVRILKSNSKVAWVID